MTVRFETLDGLKAFVGQVAVSEWVTVSQQMIDQFAEVTQDRQWIHIDVERARRESPFGGPVAHGFLTISLFPHLMHTAVELPPVKAGINYGCDKLRFVAPVAAGSRVRGVLKLLDIEEVPGMLQLRWDLTIEREGADKPAVVAVWLSRIVP
ncbi:MAG: MaoC family dehydratase [Betaproteobacteria bacterium]|nr:MaoC family dehydratase [Betaproteobacteria bacterium]MDE2048128.1 MaoC family dehydratase [Betaproteobacteria bacterium]